MIPREILAVASAEDGLLAERLEEWVNVSGGDLRGDGICMISSEHELYAVATSLPDSVITKEALAKMGIGIGDCEADAGGDNASGNPQVCSSGDAAVQDTTAGDSIS